MQESWCKYGPRQRTLYYNYCHRTSYYKSNTKM